MTGKWNIAQRRHMLVTGGILASVAVVVGILYMGLQIDQSKLPNTIEGKPAYPFRAEWIQGQEYLSSSSSTAFGLDDLKGKPVILNFWASWCVSCRSEAHELEAFWQKYRSDGVLVIGIAIQDTHDAAKEFAKIYGKTYILGLDTEGKASIDYGVTGVPETFILDRNGLVVHKEVGPVTQAILEKHLANIL